MDVAQYPVHSVTSILDIGGLAEQIASTRAAIGSGKTAGPSIYAVGPTLNGERFAPFHRVLTSAAAVKTTIAELADSGVDMIKIHSAFVPELLPVVIEAAHARGLRVTGHIPLGVSPLQACESGMDGIEHVGSFLEALAAAPGEKFTGSAAIAYLESDRAAPLYECLVRRGTTVTPTLVVYPAVARRRTGNGPLPQQYHDFINAVQRITLRLHRAGVTLLAGTDTASGELAIAPGASLLQELELLQQAGIAPPEIIVIATANAAATLGEGATTGSIAIGKAADFLLLEADPGIDTANLRKLRATYRAGAKVN
jgi:imidazolonepropionase-like amidohydrolase